jgi:hypothetical protein
MKQNQFCLSAFSSDCRKSRIPAHDAVTCERGGCPTHSARLTKTSIAFHNVQNVVSCNISVRRLRQHELGHATLETVVQAASCGSLKVDVSKNFLLQGQLIISAFILSRDSLNPSNVLGTKICPEAQRTINAGNRAICPRFESTLYFSNFQQAGAATSSKHSFYSSFFPTSSCILIFGPSKEIIQGRFAGLYIGGGFVRTC